MARKPKAAPAAAPLAPAPALPEALQLGPCTARDASQLLTRKVGLQTQSGQQATLHDFYFATDGNRKFEALKSFITLTWPEFVDKWNATLTADGKRRITRDLGLSWNPWLERCLRAFTNTDHAVKRGKSIFRAVVMSGCGGAGKTHAAGLYAVAWWLPDPTGSIVTLTSTTKEMISQRIWPVVNHYWSTAVHTDSGQLLSALDAIGDKVDSQKMIRAQKGDDKHAITAMAVAHGETQKAIQNIKGRHAQRMLLIIDEANGTPEAIFEVIANMRKGCRDLTVIIIGNPGSHFDPHGRALTPRDGWLSIDIDTEMWPTAVVKDWQLDAGIALRFDGFKSPNVRLGHTKWPYIYTCEDKANAEATPGYKETLNYWVMERGLHPPEGIACTVFTEALFNRCLDAHPPVYIWESQPIDIAFFDPAFTSGGDDAWLQFGRMGTFGGKLCIELGDGFPLPISVDAESYDVDYGLARLVQQHCISRGVKPYCCGVDGTGIGRGVHAILAAEWSSQICCLTFGGNASELPSAQNDGQPAKLVYDRRVTELWFSVREALESGQMRGFTMSAKAQFCCRLYEMKGKRYSIEPKAEMKIRYRGSPDEADSIAGLLHVGRQNGLVISGKIADMATREWNESANDISANIAAKTQSLLDNDGGWAESSVDEEATIGGTPRW